MSGGDLAARLEAVLQQAVVDSEMNRYERACNVKDEKAFDEEQEFAERTIRAAQEVLQARCDGCQHWGSSPLLIDRGVCALSATSDRPLSPFMAEGYVWTKADFGCLRWERKG